MGHLGFIHAYQAAPAESKANKTFVVPRGISRKHGDGFPEFLKRLDLVKFSVRHIFVISQRLYR